MDSHGQGIINHLAIRWDDLDDIGLCLGQCSAPGVRMSGFVEQRSVRSPVKSSTLSGHAVQWSERSDAGENIINQLDGMETAVRVFR